MLRKGNIFLRAIEPTDLDLILNWENDAENWRVSDTKLPFSKHLVEAYVNSAQDLYTVKQIRFIICLVEGEIPVGSIDLFDFEPFHQRVGIGILISKMHRQKGYAEKALSLISDYALKTIGVRNLYANILVDNTPSIQLFEKEGFKEAGLKKNWRNINGKWIDEKFYQKQLLS